MKKIISLIKATMTSDMNIFKIKQKGKKDFSTYVLLTFVAFALMSSIFSYANFFLEKLAVFHLEQLVLSLFVFLISFLTLIEGVYKCGPLIFNCKDDQLLLSLPIKKSTVLFIRLFKFYVFELVFNTLFFLPVIVAYAIWVKETFVMFYISSLIMLLLLPIIPIIISLILGFISSSITSKFRYKNIVQTIITFVFLLVIMYFSFNMESALTYFAEHASSINDLIMKIYYPAGAYFNLSSNFKLFDLVMFIIINLGLFAIAIYIFSKFYFKINSNLKEVTKVKKRKVGNIKIKENSVTVSLIKKEINTFVNTPVFIVNAGFALVLYIAAAIGIFIKFDYLIDSIVSSEVMSIDKSLIMSDLSLIILALVLMTGYMTSITNSLISLEGKNINILKSLPVKVKTILMSKIYACLCITTPIILFGDILLFIKFKTSIIDILLILILSILVPLVSHFVGLIVNLRYPKLDFENSAEVVKQSMSSFLAVMLGMLLFFLNIGILLYVAGMFSATIILVLEVIIYLIIDYILYKILVNYGNKKFIKLTV